MREEKMMPKKRIPSQSRGQETKERIMTAGLKLFSLKGLQGTSSRQIASAADVSIGSFYSYFHDKRDLFIELLKRHRGNVLQILSGYSAEISEGDPDLIREMIQAIWQAHPETAEFEQKADMMRSMDAEIDGILKEQETAVTESIIAFLKMTEDRLRIKNTGSAGLLITLIIREFLHSASGLNQTEMNALIDELADMISRYLFK